MKLSLSTMKNKNQYDIRYLLGIFLTFSILLQNSALAQVSVTLGAQTFYDDNIFLENDKARPAPILSNDDLADSLASPPSRLALESEDGDPDSDFITNVYLGASGNSERFKNYVDINYNIQGGLILFADFSEQNRITVDGSFDINSSQYLLPDPFYFSIRNLIQSASNNLAVASGTATQTSQNYVLSGELGVRNVPLTKNTVGNLAYVGDYQIFLGEFLLSSADDEDTRTNLGGTDFHSHTARTSVSHQLTRDLSIGLAGSGGVQLFTSIDDQTLGGSRDPSDLDRYNAEAQGTVNYIITSRLSFSGSAGVAMSTQMNDSQPFTRSTINDSGEVVSETVTPDDSDTGFTFSSALTYAFRPGSLLSVGANQGFSTNIDGQRFTSRSFFVNLVEPLTRDLQLTLAGRFFQFEDQAAIRSDTDRFEASASLDYFLRDNVSLQVGYNFTTQDSSSSRQDLSFSEADYDSNRIFIGISGGFVGLPL